MKDKTPLPKKTSTPLKSISGKTVSSFLSAMTATEKPPKDKPQNSLRDRLLKMWQENDDYSDQAILRTLREYNAKKKQGKQ